MTAVCPRCHGHYESLLHRVCEARLQLAERDEGWRRTQVRIEPHVQALAHIRRSPTGKGRRLELEPTCACGCGTPLTGTRRRQYVNPKHKYAAAQRRRRPKEATS